MSKSATSTETAKRKQDLAKAREAGAVLCEAVKDWVRSLGGVPIKVTDIRANESGNGRYRVSLSVRGTWPRKKYELK